jgi:LacI family transcriptional regulator
MNSAYDSKPKSSRFRKPKDIPRVALLIETSRAYGRRIIEGVASYVRENGPWLLHTEPRALTDPLPEWLANWQGDGIIARVVDEKSARLLRASGLPVVNIKANAENCLGPALVANDQPAIGRLAAEHFLERGFRDFAFVGATGFPWSDARQAGYEKTLKDFGFPCTSPPRSRVRLMRGRDGALGQEIPAVADWLRGLPKPLAVFAADDFMALDLLNACRLAGIAVPEEVAVLGVDNETAICEFSDPALSSIVPDNVRLGYEAAAILERMMRGEPAPQRSLPIPPHGIAERRSTDVMTIEDPVAARAMAFIREHACSGIQAADVACHCATSASTLQRRLRKWINCSPHEAILRVRIARAKQLLADTNLPLKSIAPRVGYPRVEHFCALFKEQTGQTLKQFRDRSR